MAALCNKFVVMWTDSMGGVHYLKEHSSLGRMIWVASYEGAHRFNLKEVAETWCQRMGGTSILQEFYHERGEPFFGGVQRQVEGHLFKLS